MKIMRTPSFGTVIMYLLALLIAVDCVLFVLVRNAGRVARRDDPWQAFLDRAPFPLPSGFAADGRRVSAEQGTVPRCWTVRYSSPLCEFCREGAHGAWGRLATALQREGCAAYVIAPTARSAFGKRAATPADAIKIEFLSTAWLRAPFSVAPTTLLFGPDRRLLWVHQGEMDAKDVSSALAVLRAGMEPR